MNLILSIFHPKADTIRQESIFAIRTIRTLILSCIVILTNHSAQASLLAEADKLYKNKKWGEAAKTYEVFASSKPMGRNYWYARLRTALAKEKIGDIKNDLAKARKYDDAIKLYRTISIRHTGNLKTEALFHIGNCLCNMARYTQAASVWDELGSHGGSNLKIRCLRRKADMVLTEMRNVKSARTFYCEAMEILKSEGSNNPYELRDITTFIAICDAANGKVDDAEPVFRREYERALKRMDVNIMKWHALISACAAIREYGSYKGDTLRDVIIADLLAASGHYQEAINLFRKCLSQQHISRDLLAFAAMQMAECLDRNNQHSEALKTYQLIRIHYKDCRCAPLAMLRAGVLCVGSMNDDTGGRQFFKFIEDTWPKDSIAEQALFYRLTLAIWTEQWEEATKLRKEFFRRHPDSDKRKIVEVEYGELIARRITVLEENIIQ